MSTNPVLRIPPNIAAQTAPLILGEISSAYLFGVLSVQLYIYHLNFPDDKNYIKAFVYIVFLLEFASSIMSISDIYHWFAEGFGNILTLGEVEVSTVDTPMIGSFVAAAVQMFYCYRIYTIKKKAWGVSVVVAFLALTQVVVGIFGAVVLERGKLFANAGIKGKVAIYILFICAPVADVVIATTMIVLLVLSKGRRIQAASPDSSASRIKKLVNLIVETNLASASMAILTVILFAALPNTNYFICPSYVVGKIYSNSLLLILNNRYYLTIGAATGERSSGLFKMSKLRNKSANDFLSSGSHSREPTRIELDNVIAIDSVPPGAFNYGKAGFKGVEPYV